MRPAFFVVFFVVLFAGLAVGFVLGRFMSQPQAPPPTQPSVPTTTSTQPATPSAPVSPTDPLEVFNTPPQDASPEEIQRYTELVRSLAEDVDSVEIKGCTPTPLVLRVRHGESVVVKNQDAVDHSLLHGETVVSLPASSTTSIIPSDFGKVGAGEGIIGYACDEPTAVGIFYVIP